MNDNILDYVKIIAKGLVVGFANIIPGVSGGTMALVLGIYERLIVGIHNINFDTIKICLKLFTFKKENRKNFFEEMKRIDFIFLFLIFLGALSSVVMLAKITTYMLETYHDPTYGFFFGLILVSIIIPYKTIKRKSVSVWLFVFLGVTVVAGTATLVSNDDIIFVERAKFEMRSESHAGSNNYLESEMNLSEKKAFIVVLSGALSLSAMILPGVSGSFILILLGQYFFLVKAVSEGYFVIIGLYFIGGVIGILLFTRIITFLLKNWHDKTMGFLTGLVAGSLWVIWPFRNLIEIGDSSVKGYPRTIYLNNTLPSQITANEILTLLTIIIGALVILFMIMLEKKLNKIEK